MIVSTKKRWPPSLPLVLSEAKALMAFMNGLAARPWVGTPVFSVQYGEVGFIHWGERTTIYKNDSRDEKRQVGTMKEGCRLDMGNSGFYSQQSPMIME